ncbi:MAG: FTR1 family protein [Moritella sp.]|uniref:FTR1 family iron permease n=1 Tax=Moritella sp. TaxID=78556 RepID=UPI001D97414A|nr:FTR1 family protein [Moritella sp.]NQZ51497.1 FTR1 family protein [Moritella sp.]
MFASFLITFREGLEAFLLVGIILSYLAKLGQSKHNKLIYLGVALGLIASLIVAFIFQFVVDQFDAHEYRNLLMAGILGFATLVLTYMAIWMQRQAKTQVSNMQQNIREILTTGNVFGLIFLAFLAVMREGFETVLFFSALMYSGQGDFSLQDGLIGAGAGLIASLILVIVLMRGTRKVPLQAFFKWTSLLIIIIAAGLLSSASNMLQSADVLPVFQTAVFDISHILNDQGVFGTFLRALFGYNSSPNLLPLVIWFVYLAIFTVFWHRGYQVPAKTAAT